MQFKQNHHFVSVKGVLFSPFEFLSKKNVRKKNKKTLMQHQVNDV